MPTVVRDSPVVSQTVGSASSSFDVVCFSHLRWDFVFQRPQHLLTRAAATGRVFYVEEPVFEETAAPQLRLQATESGVTVVKPVLPTGLHQLADAQSAIEHAQHLLIHELVRTQHLAHFVAWYYTPMALAFTGDLNADAIVYDCMDELSAFRGAPPQLIVREEELLKRADVVFTGGASLYQSKRHRHANAHLFASSVDVAHFAQARKAQADPEDQQSIPHPRVGFYGVLDERLDLDLLRDLAALRPNMQFVILGPLAKLSETDLPRAANLHYLGAKRYSELPRYLAGWNAAMLPFALNESTRFISPTKTPEYLAAHRQAVSTPIRDVVSPYGDEGLVAIAKSAQSFAEALDRAVQPPTTDWLEKVDTALATNSWQRTWEGMQREIIAVLAD